MENGYHRLELGKGLASSVKLSRGGLSSVWDEHPCPLPVPSSFWEYHTDYKATRQLIEPPEASP